MFTRATQSKSQSYCDVFAFLVVLLPSADEELVLVRVVTMVVIWIVCWLICKSKGMEMR
jgi:hypothetical protein